MVCPKCGNKKALLLLTSFQCPNMSCKNYSQELACDIWTAGIAKMTGTKSGRLGSKPKPSKPKKKSHWSGFLKKRYFTNLNLKSRKIDKS
jgi:hypothetical protein